MQAQQAEEIQCPIPTSYQPISEPEPTRTEPGKEEHLSETTLPDTVIPQLATKEALTEVGQAVPESEIYNYSADLFFKLAHLGGDSSQMVLTALGKILVWRENWEPWFRGNDGKVVVYKDRCIPKSALTLANLTIAQQSYDIGQVPFSLKRKPRKRTIRKRPIAPEQPRLME